MTRQIVVEVVGDATKFSKATDQATTKAQGLTGKLQGVGKGMVIGAGIGAFNLLSGVVDTAIGKLGEAAAAFREDEAGQSRLALALKNNIPNWDGNTSGAEGFAGSLGRLGFEDDAIRESLGQLVGITHDLDEAQKLTSLSADLARAKHIDLAQATDIVTKAAQGNGKALKGLGIDVAGVTDAAGFLDAVQKNVKGSAEAWATTNEGKVAVSNVKVSEAMEKVGSIVDKVAQVVLPALADALSWIVDNVVPPLAAAFDWLSKHVFPILSTAIGALARGPLPVLASAFGAIGTIVTNVWNGITGAIKGGVNFVIGLINGMVGRINGIQIHIPGIDTPFGKVAKFDWPGLRLATIPYLHAGGLVPGAPGSDVLAMLQAGERVLPASSGAGITIVVQGDVYGDGIDQLADKLALRLRLAGA